MDLVEDAKKWAIREREAREARWPERPRVVVRGRPPKEAPHRQSLGREVPTGGRSEVPGTVLNVRVVVPSVPQRRVTVRRQSLRREAPACGGSVWAKGCCVVFKLLLLLCFGAAFTILISYYRLTVRREVHREYRELFCKALNEAGLGECTETF